MKKHSDKKNLLEPKSKHHGISNIEGYPLYPDNEDIYNKSQKDETIDTDGISRHELDENEKLGANNEKEFEQDKSGDELDIPGVELDNQQEAIGSEDEENNHYSIGGDRHDDLEEDKG